MTTTTASDKTFGRDVLGASVPVLVEFSAAASPSNAALNELSTDMATKLKVVKVDVGCYPNLKDEYGVRGLPALVLFKHGKPVARMVGSRHSKTELEEWINGALILALATRRTAAGRAAAEFKLANGMQIIVIPDDRVPAVTHLVWYKVGSAHEPRDFQGLARFVGHLSFKSLNKIANGDAARAITRLGGNTNARFSRYASVYWQRLASAGIETTMRMETERMLGLHLNDEEVATERQVLLELRSSSVDLHPDSRLVEKLEASLYRTHTYNLPSAAMAQEINRLSREDVLRFHNLHYAPNNAILVVAGDVTPDTVLRLAGETYGKIPANPDVDLKVPGTVKAAMRPIMARVEVEAETSATGRLRRWYAVPVYGEAPPGDTEALQVLAEILAGGIGSKLYRNLVIGDKIATSVAGGYYCAVPDRAELRLALIADGCDLSALEAGVDQTIEGIRRHGVSQAELQLAKRSLVANFILRSSDQFELAHRHALGAALLRTAKDVEDWPAAISRVCAADVLRVARDYVVSRRSVTGHLLPKRDRHRRRAGSATGQRSVV